MAEGMRVFTDATQSSPSGCKNSIARLLQKDVRRARYLDPRTSRWLSTDPALTDYLPLAPVDENAKKHNQNLPGMGGIYNTVNFHLYHYAGNNPVKYTDPDGREDNLPEIPKDWTEPVYTFGVAGSATGPLMSVASTAAVYFIPNKNKVSIKAFTALFAAYVATKISNSGSPQGMAMEAIAFGALASVSKEIGVMADFMSSGTGVPAGRNFTKYGGSASAGYNIGVLRSKEDAQGVFGELGTSVSRGIVSVGIDSVFNTNKELIGFNATIGVGVGLSVETHARGGNTFMVPLWRKE